MAGCLPKRGPIHRAMPGWRCLGSLNQLGQSFRKMAWTTHFVDADDAGNVAAAINENTRAVFIESLANPGGVA